MLLLGCGIEEIPLNVLSGHRQLKLIRNIYLENFAVHENIYI